MTLHINIITPNHVINVSDRLISTPTGYKEFDNDRYKHMVLITDDAKAVISFAGFAGLSDTGGQLKESMIDWLTKVIQETSAKGHHGMAKHLDDIWSHAQEYMNKLRSRMQPKYLRLAVLVSGWDGAEQFNYVIDNCLETNLDWTNEARPIFQQRFKKYGDAKFEDGSYILFLGDAQLARRQTTLIEQLELDARSEQPRKIFDTSVKVIRAAAAESNDRAVDHGNNDRQ